MGKIMTEYIKIDGGVTVAQGYQAAGVHAGLKYKALDFALLYSDVVANVAGVFTTNKIKGSPVKLCQELLVDHEAQAVVINSGNANACNGGQGMVDAVSMRDMAATALGIDKSLMLVCSTGTIGVPLPMNKIENGISKSTAALTYDGGDGAAKAIMTTDTVDKQYAVELMINGKSVRIGGMAKGSGMIEPNMATMLSYITTDAKVEKESLQDALSAAVATSFNKISVDGDQSCNDTVLLFANGYASTELLNIKHPEWNLFCEALNEVCRQLAFMIVKDGEGATKFVTVTVNGAATVDDAKLATRAIANSLLVKTSWCGGDPNWGRVIDVVGYSGADVREELVDIGYNDIWMVKNGCRVPGQPLEDLEKILAEDEFVLTVNLNLGDDSDTVYTCDCSEEYVKINSAYMT
jgi:glutamate N-acetyltransferase/amino-acid N-acetyltransferase